VASCDRSLRAYSGGAVLDFHQLPKLQTEQLSRQKVLVSCLNVLQDSALSIRL
jgi:hypothetical protein